jgi:hypothetical protein
MIMHPLLTSDHSLPYLDRTASKACSSDANTSTPSVQVWTMWPDDGSNAMICTAQDRIQSRQCASSASGAGLVRRCNSSFPEAWRPLSGGRRGHAGRDACAGMQATRIDFRCVQRWTILLECGIRSPRAPPSASALPISPLSTSLPVGLQQEWPTCESFRSPIDVTRTSCPDPLSTMAITRVVLKPFTIFPPLISVTHDDASNHHRAVG